MTAPLSARTPISPIATASAPVADHRDRHSGPQQREVALAQGLEQPESGSAGPDRSTIPGGSASAIMGRVLRHMLAPHVPGAAARLGIARVLPEGAAAGAGAGRGGVALTFDDGPHPEGTPAVLELLAGANAHAWFFLVGEQVVRRPSLAREIAAAGHVVAVHGFRHVPQPFLGARAVRDDLVRARAAIVDATGVSPTYHRPPYGLYSPPGLAAVRSAGLTPLLWSRWGKDWRKFTTPRRIASRVVGDLRARDVILLHDADFYSSRDSHRRTAEALEIILRELKALELDTVLPV